MRNHGSKKNAEYNTFTNESYYQPYDAGNAGFLVPEEFDGEQRPNRRTVGCRVLLLCVAILLLFVVLIKIVTKNDAIVSIGTAAATAATMDSYEEGHGTRLDLEISPTIELSTSGPVDLSMGEHLSQSPIDSSRSIGVNVFDKSSLSLFMLDLINQDRERNGVSQLQWDDVAALAGNNHAQDMVAHGFFSHWNQDGLGPDHRYSQAGGGHAVMENIYTFAYQYQDGSGAPIDDWLIVIENAQKALMDSIGHRTNILDPAHTHVGVGMAYDPGTGQFRLTQEFTNHYTQLDALPGKAIVGQEVRVRGEFIGDILNNTLLNVVYEPYPSPHTIEELNETGAYMSAANREDNIVSVLAVDRIFDETILLDHSHQGGFYHVRLFVDLAAGQAMVLDHVIEVN